MTNVPGRAAWFKEAALVQVQHAPNVELDSAWTEAALGKDLPQYLLNVRMAMCEVATHAFEKRWMRPDTIVVAALVDDGTSSVSIGGRGAVSALTLAWDGFAVANPPHARLPWYEPLKAELADRFDQVERALVAEEFESHKAQAENGASIPGAHWSHAVMDRLERDAALDAVARKPLRDTHAAAEALKESGLMVVDESLALSAREDRQSPLRYEYTEQPPNTSGSADSESGWFARQPEASIDIMRDPARTAHIELQSVMQLQTAIDVYHRTPRFFTQTPGPNVKVTEMHCALHTHEEKVQGAPHLRAVMLRMHFQPGREYQERTGVIGLK